MKLICNFLRGNISSKILPVFLASLCLLPSCRQLASQNSFGPISSINIVDRNGITETISEKNRLKPFQNTDFLSPQPYQKVLRVFARDQKGDVRSEITSYHPNGQVKQYLEAVNNRAFGCYREWHPNGQLKIEAAVIGGIADLNTHAESDWLFDGKNLAWDEEGRLLAEIPYKKGELEGEARYFHSDGKVWKISPFCKNVLHGTEKIYLPDGNLFQATHFVKGLKEGPSFKYWNTSLLAAEELYEKGLLVEGKYFDKEGRTVSQIHRGFGFKPLFGKQRVHEFQEYKNGIHEGLVKVFDDEGHTISTYFVKKGEKDGTQVDFYKSGKPKLHISWQEGIIQGVVKTWYENGSIESQKEIVQNKKNGLATVWYENGQLMLAEEYENEKLIKGEYFRMGEKLPASKIENGKGIATLFDAKGHFTKKINYSEGKPLD